MGKRDDAAAEWEPYKALIRRLYVTEDMQLPHLMAFMENGHSFSKSEPQYRRQFKKWGFSKYSNQREYEYMGYVEKKRKFENKGTKFDVRGNRVGSEQLAKKLRRYLPKGFDTVPLTENGPPTPEGIQILSTPARTGDFHIVLAALPFFQFQQFLRQTAFFKELQFSFHFDFATISTDAIIPQTASKYEKVPARFLEAVTVGQTEEELRHSSAAIIHGPPADALFYTISYCVYLSSNNLLPDRNLDKIVEWMMTNEQPLPLFNSLEPSSPTVVIFMRQLLGSVARLGYTSFMCSLLQVCVSCDDPKRIFRSHSLLFEAIKYNQLELASHILDAGVDLNNFPYYLDVIIYENHHEMLKLLLFRGLRDDTKASQWPSLLEGAVEKGKTTIVEILLDFEANSVHSIWEETFFRALVTNGDVARLFVRAGINVGIEFEFDYDQIEGYMSEEHLFFYPIQTPLQVAAQTGDGELVKCLVEYGAALDLRFSSVSAPECEKWTAAIEEDFDITDVIPVVSALQAAVRDGNIDMTLFLLRKGARVDGRPLVDKRPRNVYGHTALQIAAATGNRDLVNLLIKWKANVNAPPGFYKGRTALQFAAGLQDRGIFDILLVEGARIKAEAGRGGKTVLQSAAYAGNFELVQFLLQYHYTDVNEPPSPEGGRTALQAASESQTPFSIDMMKMLLSAGADSNAFPAKKRGITALQGAASAGNLAKAELLLAANAETEVCSDQYGSTALHKAIENGHPEMVAFLLRYGPTPNYGASTATGRTPLQEACWNGDTHIASLLLSKIPDNLRPILVNIPASFNGGVTALQAAVESGNLELMNLLLKLGADPNAPGAAVRGKTALERAAYGSDFKMLRVLLERGVRFPAGWEIPQSRWGIFRTVCSWRARELTSLITGSGLDITVFPLALVKVALIYTIRMEKFHLIDVLLSSGVLPIDAGLDENYTGLQLAASLGSVGAVEVFIKHGANVNELGLDHWAGRTALWLAVEDGHVEVAKYLLAHGAKVEISTRGKTVLQAAAGRGEAELVRYLVEHSGADINAPGPGNFGRTALQAAAEHGHVEIVKYLLERGAEVNAPPFHYRGVTALQAAAIKGQAGILMILLDAEADVTAPGATRHGRTAIEGAAEHGRLDILHILLQVHPPGQSLDEQLGKAEELAEEEKHFEIVRVIQNHRTF